MRAKFVDKRRFKRGEQLPLRRTAGWGGKRAGAGRKPIPGRRSPVPHIARDRHNWRHPVHVTLRARGGLPSLRSTFAPIREALGRASKASFRLLHYSVQSDHVHLLVEANSKRSLALGIRGLEIRVARAVNRALDNQGPVWGDRYHARAIHTPREMRNALVYVLMNVRKHHPGHRGLDPCSSVLAVLGDGDDAVAAPTSWLARSGWRRHGDLRVSDEPKLLQLSAKRLEPP